MASRKYAETDRDRCVACGACMKVCPKGAITVRHGCYAAADKKLCIGCGKCANICPADCIILKERAEQ